MGTIWHQKPPLNCSAQSLWHPISPSTHHPPGFENFHFVLRIALYLLKNRFKTSFVFSSLLLWLCVCAGESEDPRNKAFGAIKRSLVSVNSVGTKTPKTLLGQLPGGWLFSNSDRRGILEQGSLHMEFPWVQFNRDQSLSSQGRTRPCLTEGLALCCTPIQTLWGPETIHVCGAWVCLCVCVCVYMCVCPRSKMVKELRPDVFRF